MGRLHSILSFLFFEGRILNRFSKDMGLVDDMFSFVFFDFTQVWINMIILKSPMKVVDGFYSSSGAVQPLYLLVPSVTMSLSALG